jgi:HK97 family phage portal protein
MNLIKRLFRRTQTTEKRSHSLESLLGARSINDVAGVNVTETTALNLTSCFACIHVISEDLASLELPVYERIDKGIKIEAFDHPNYWLLHDEPNEEQPSIIFRETMIQYLLRWGNAYAEIERSNGGQALALHIIPPANVTPERDKSGLLQYKINSSTGQTAGVIPDKNMIHLRLMGDGVLGYSPIKMAKQAIGLGLAEETYGSAFFSNSALPGGVISHPNTLSEPAIKNLRESLHSTHGGPSKFGKWMVLEEGATVSPFIMSNSDFEFLSSRVFQLQEIARIYRVPLHLIGDMSGATFSNIEEQSVSYVRNTLRPLAVRIEQELNMKLFNEAERRVFFCAHNLDSIMRGDLASRTAALSQQLLNGVINHDEWRDIEGRNPIEDPSKHFMQAQMKSLEDIQKGTDVDTPPEPPQEEEDRSRMVELETRTQATQDALRGVLADTLGRMDRREAKAIRQAAKHPREFIDRIEAFYETHRSFMAQAIEPTLKAWMVFNGEEHEGEAAKFSERITSGSRESLVELSGEVTADGLKDAIEDWVMVRVGSWSVIEGVDA